MEEMKNMLHLLVGKGRDLEVTLNPPATEKELESLKEALGQELPKDIFDFYSCCNGIETLDFIFRVLPIDEILKYKNELGGSSFYFAEYMIYSDTWIITLKGKEEYVITNNNHGADKTVELTESLLEFIDRYSRGGVFETNGLCDWYEEIRLDEKYL